MSSESTPHDNIRQLLLKISTLEGQLAVARYDLKIAENQATLLETQEAKTRLEADKIKVAIERKEALAKVAIERKEASRKIKEAKQKEEASKYVNEFFQTTFVKKVDAQRIIAGTMKYYWRDYKRRNIPKNFQLNELDMLEMICAKCGGNSTIDEFYGIALIEDDEAVDFSGAHLTQ